MFHENYEEIIDKFEHVLQKITTETTRGVIFEHLPPMDLWNKTETYVTQLRELAENCKEAMLILKPEKAHIVEQRFKAVTQPLNTFKEILFQKTTDPLANSRLAFEQLSKAIAEGANFLLLAREIQKNPSPAIKEILMLKRMAEKIESASAVESTETSQLKPARLIWRVESLRASLIGLERGLEEAKDSLNMLRKEILKYGYASVESPITEKKESESEEPEERRLSLSKFPR
jgi:hypothetical protein